MVPVTLQPQKNGPSLLLSIRKVKDMGSFSASKE